MPTDRTWQELSRFSKFVMKQRLVGRVNNDSRTRVCPSAGWFGVTWCHVIISGGPGRQPLQQCRLLVMPKGLPAVPSTCGQRPLAISHHGALTMPQKMVDISHSCCKFNIDQYQYSKSRTPEPPATYVGSATSSVAFAEPAAASLAPQARWSYEGIWSQRSFWATLPLCFGLLRRCMATASPFFLATSTSDSTFELAHVFSFWAVSSHGFFAWGFRWVSNPFGSTSGKFQGISRAVSAPWNLEERPAFIACWETVTTTVLKSGGTCLRGFPPINRRRLVLMALFKEGQSQTITSQGQSFWTALGTPRNEDWLRTGSHTAAFRNTYR